MSDQASKRVRALTSDEWANVRTAVIKNGRTGLPGNICQIIRAVTGARYGPSQDLQITCMYLFLEMTEAEIWEVFAAFGEAPEPKDAP